MGTRYRNERGGIAAAVWNRGDSIEASFRPGLNRQEERRSACHLRAVARVRRQLNHK